MGRVYSHAHIGIMRGGAVYLKNKWPIKDMNYIRMNKRTKLNLTFAGLAILMGMVFLEGWPRNVFIGIALFGFFVVYMFESFNLDENQHKEKEYNFEKGT